MSQFIVHCSGENIALGLAELQALIPEADVSQLEHTAYLLENVDESTIKEITPRFAFIRYITKIAAICPTVIYAEQITKAIQQAKELQHIQEPIWVTVEKLPNATKKLSSDFVKLLAVALNNPSAAQKDFKTHLHIVVTAKKTYICTNPVLSDTSYLKRKPTLRPYVHPSTIQPQLARALINLSGVERGIIWDPFCGIGGLLLEAAILTLYVKGTDIDATMVSTATKMLNHYNISAYQLSLGDATKMQEKCDAVITDVPYGKNTKNISADLYERFLYNIKSCTKIAVVVFPDFTDVEALLKKTGWKKRDHIKHYVHKSLSKHIYIIYQ